MKRTLTEQIFSFKETIKNTTKYTFEYYYTNSNGNKVQMTLVPCVEDERVTLIFAPDTLNKEFTEKIGIPVYENKIVEFVKNLKEDDECPIIVTDDVGLFLYNNPKLYKGPVLSVTEDKEKSNYSNNFYIVKNFYVHKGLTCSTEVKDEQKQAQNLESNT